MVWAVASLVCHQAAAFASISPPLDASGNSVKGQAGAAAFAAELGAPVSLVR